MPEDVATVPLRARTHRLIASRWPTIGVFDTVASAEDLEAALLLESLTNDRVDKPWRGSASSTARNGLSISRGPRW